MDIVKIAKRFVSKLEYRHDLRTWKKKITDSYKLLKDKRKLSKEQKKEIQDFYKDMIGREVPLYSHEYFYSRTGYFTKEYVPTNLYHCELIRKANYFPYMYVYSDKNMHDILLEKENTAHVILKNMNGYYFYEGKHDDGKIEAATLCLWRNHISTATNFSTSSSDVAQLVANLTIVRPSAAFSQKLNSTV